MAGQYKTRRNPDTGRLEKVPEAEQGSLRAADEGIAPPPPAVTVTQQDADFVNAGSEPPPLPDAAEPPPLPPKAPPVQPPPLPPAEEEEEDSGAGGAAQGAMMGSKAGPWGAVIGGAVGFAAGRKGKPAPIGTPEGGAVAGQSDDTLRELLAVQQGIARMGSPIKDAITTNAATSRM